MIKLKEDIKGILENSGYSLVKFSAPWCQSCKAYTPDLDVAEQNFPEVNFYEVDLEESFEQCTDYNIKSLPTLLLFLNGKEIARTNRVPLNDLLSFIADNTSPREYTLNAETGRVKFE